MCRVGVREGGVGGFCGGVERVGLGIVVVVGYFLGRVGCLIVMWGNIGILGCLFFVVEIF